MIPYYQILENNQDTDHIGARFDGFDYDVLIEDYYCENPECDCMCVFLSFNILQHDVKEVERLFSIMLDMNSWEIAKPEIYNKKIKVDEMIAGFMKNLDEFKEDFKSHYKAVKQYGKTLSGKKDRP